MKKNDAMFIRAGALPQAIIRSYIDRSWETIHKQGHYFTSIRGDPAAGVSQNSGDHFRPEKYFFKLVFSIL